MPYVNTYRLQYTNTEQQPCCIEIAQKSSFDPSGVTVYTELLGGPSPFTVQTFDTENKFTPIWAKSCSIQFYSTDTIGIHTFTGEDDEWIVTAWVQEPVRVIFKGFLVMSDNEQGYVTYTDEVVTLTATDNLGLLREVALTDDSGINPKGKFKIIQFLAWALKKTGLSLPINVINNLCEESFVNLPFYDNIYLDAKTFEAQIGVSVDCYAAISYILGYDCYLTQFKGEWYIIRVDELQGSNVTRHVFDADGIFVSTNSGEAYLKAIGHNLSIDFVNETTRTRLERPHKLTKLNFRYDYPLEIIDNIDFSRGDWVSPLVLPNETIDGLSYDAKAYHIDDWNLFKNVPATTADTQAYIKRLFYEGYEKERYVVIEKSSGGGFYYIVVNQRMPIGHKDRFSIGVSLRYSGNIGGSGFFRNQAIQVRLYGEDNTYWTLHGGTSSDTRPRWVQSNSSFTLNNSYVWLEGDLANDDTEWQDVSASAPATPVAGELEILLIHQSNTTIVHRYFQNLRFDYEPYINGSYAKYYGHYNKITQSGTHRAKIDEQVFLGDAPRKVFKGAMFKLISGKYTLAQRWYNAAVFPGGLPAAEFLKSYGNTQCDSVWNQNRNDNRIFNVTLTGINSDLAPNMPDGIHQFYFTDSNPNVDNKYFMLVSFRMDYYLCQWEGTLIEVYDEVKGKRYDDTYELKFLQG